MARNPREVRLIYTLILILVLFGLGALLVSIK